MNETIEQITTQGLEEVKFIKLHYPNSVLLRMLAVEVEMHEETKKKLADLALKPEQKALLGLK